MCPIKGLAGRRIRVETSNIVVNLVFSEPGWQGSRYGDS
jgi:hypothetical protein